MLTDCCLLIYIVLSIERGKLSPLIIFSLPNLLQERMTLRHKNKNRWAERIIQRGLNNQDDGTRAAIAEQHQMHAALTRKMHSMKGSSSSSSDDTSDEDDGDENSSGSDQDRVSKILGKAKDKTMKVLEEEDEVPKSGLLSLPFMVITDSFSW